MPASLKQKPVKLLYLVSVSTEDTVLASLPTLASVRSAEVLPVASARTLSGVTVLPSFLILTEPPPEKPVEELRMSISRNSDIF